MERSVTFWPDIRILVTGATMGMLLASAAACVGYASGDLPAPWVPPIQKADEALARKEYGVALRATDDARQIAHAARRWEGLVAVGDAYRRIGAATEAPRAFDPKAHDVYLAALFRARQEGSVDGVLRVAEGFAAMGDAELVARCIRIAEILAAHDADAQADIREFAAQWAHPTLTAHQPRHSGRVPR